MSKSSSIRMVAQAKQIYKGENLYSGKAFIADDTDVADMETLGLARREKVEEPVGESEAGEASLMTEKEAVYKDREMNASKGRGSRRAGYNRADAHSRED